MPNRILTYLAIAATCAPLALAAADIAAPRMSPVASSAMNGDPDSDGDGVTDLFDNCVNTPNPPQIDSNGDGLGNRCDADFNGDCIVNAADLGIFRSVFFSADADADLNGDGTVNAIDLGLFRNLFFAAPGPSGVPNVCDGTLLSLTLTGRLVDPSVSGASVTVVVDGTDSGGAMVEFATTTDVDGRYSVTVTATSNSAFVSLKARGDGVENEIEMSSLAGAFFALAAVSGGDGTVDETEDRDLDLSQLSTALAVLIAERNGGPVRNADDHNLALASVETASLIRLAAAIKATTHNTFIALPGGVATTLELIDDPARLQDNLDLLEVNFPAEFAQAISDTAQQRADAYTPAQPPQTLYLVVANSLGVTDGRRLEFAPGGTGTYTDLSSGAPFSWSIDVDGNVNVDLAPGLLAGENIVSIEDPDNPGTFIETPQQVFLDAIRLRRLVDTQRADHVFATETTRLSYPDLPSVGDLTTVEQPASSNARLAYDDNPVPLAPASFAGKSIALGYVHRDNFSEGTIQPAFGFDTLDFLADGTGTTRRRGFSFDWSIGSDDELLLEFGNGDVNQVLGLFEDQNGFTNTLIIADLVGEPTYTRNGYLIERDTTPGFTNATLENRRFRSELATARQSTAPLRVFDFVFLPGGAACRSPGSGFTQWNWSEVDGRMQLERTRIDDGSNYFFRTWEPIGQINGDYLVIEMLQLALGDPLVDPATTPGRPNLYTVEQDLGVNLPATTIADSFTTTQDTPLNIFKFEILGNDLDPENDELFLLFADGNSSNGGLVEPTRLDQINITSLRYTPPPGFSGIDSFSYYVTDDICDSSGAAGSVQINVL